MSYTVPNMRLIPQTRTMACWYAAGQMLVAWRRNHVQATEIDILDPSEVPEAVKIHAADNGLQWADVRRYAQQIGLVPLPLMSPSTERLETWLRQYGPLWCSGSAINEQGNPRNGYHTVVISGVEGRGNDGIFQIHDPWPPNHGEVLWLPIEDLTAISFGSRNTFLLHLPRLNNSRSAIEENIPTAEIQSNRSRGME